MWTALFFALFVAQATAEYGWKPNSEYRYEVESKTLVSFHQVTDHYSGVVIKAQVTVQPKSDSHLTVKISQPQYAKVQTSLPQGLESPIPEGQLQYLPLSLSTESFEVKLDKGVVEELVISKDVPNWEVNIIRSIVSQLQIDTEGKRVIPSKLNSIPRGDENTAVYKVMEDTVEGDCEVLYDITPLPKYILQRMPHLAPQPQLAGQGQIIDVMKTKNFTNCEQRPGYHFGLTALTDWIPTTNKMGNFLSRSSVSRIIVSGSLRSYTIQSSVTTNKVILSPEVYNNQKGQVVSRVNLTLTSVHSVSQKLQEPTNPQTIKKLVYDYNSPGGINTKGKSVSLTIQKNICPHCKFTLQKIIRNRRSIEDDINRTVKQGTTETTFEGREEWHQQTPSMIEAPETPFLPYFVGYTGRSVQHSKDINIVETAKKIAQKIGHELNDLDHVPEKNTLARFSILTRLIRTMNVKQLEQLTQELYTPEQTGQEGTDSTRRNAWMAYRDAVVQAGTGPALMTIVNFVTTQKVKGEEAAQVVGPLAETARYPTAEYMNTFFEFVKKSEVMSQAGLNTSAIIAFTNLVRMAQVNNKTSHNRYPVHAFGYLIPKHETTVSDMYIPYFSQQLEQAVREQNSQKIQTYIRGLGNFAHPKIVQVFEPYLNGKQPITDFQRTLIVVSLNKLALVYPELARSVLYKTYTNTGETYQVRVAAVYNLMKTVPPTSMLQRMAQFTHEDPSNQVRSAVKSAIASAAVSTDEYDAELRRNAEAAVHLLTPQTFGVQYSQQNLTDYIIKGLNLVYMGSLTNIGSEDSLIPQTIFYHLNRNLNGFRHQSISAGGMVSSFKDLEDLLDEKFKYSQYLESSKEVQSATEKGLTIETISNILNMESGSTKKLEGNVLIGLTGFKRFLTFDNSTIENLPRMITEMVQKLQGGKKINYQKIYNEYSITIGLPTATGLPLVYDLKTPTLLSAKGKIQVHTTSPKQNVEGVYIIPDAVNVTTEMHYQYSTRAQSKISFITPFDHTRYIAGYDKNNQLQLPVKAKLDLDMIHRHIKLEVMPLTENKDTKLFHYSTWPFVAIDNILEFKPTAESTNIYRVKSRQPQKYQQQFGDQHIGVVFRVEGESDRDYTNLRKFYERFQKHGLMTALLSSVISENIESTILDIYYDGQGSTAKSVILTASYEYSPVEQTTEQTHQEHEGGNGATTTVKTADSQTRRQEFLNKVKQGIKSCSSVVVDLGALIVGKTNTEYVATVAFASSPVDGQTRVLSYVRKNINNQNFEVCLDAVTQIPKIPVVNFLRVLETELKGDIVGKVNFGEECHTGSKISLVGDFKRSQERKEYLEKQPIVELAKQEAQRGYKFQPSQQYVAKEVGVLDDYYFTVKYENIPENIRNMTYQTYSALRFLGYPYISENPLRQSNLQEGQLELGVNFSPDLNAVNVYIYSPLGDSRFSNIRLNQYLTKGLPIHPMYSTVERIANVVFDGKYGAKCTVDLSNVRTFDNQSYTVNMEKVWHVMLFSDLKGTYETPITNEEVETTDYMIVLIKNTADKQKVIKVILKGLEYSVIDITPKTEGEVLKGGVSVNGQEVPISTHHVYQYQSDDRTTVLQVYGMPSGEVKVVSPLYKFEILYIGGSVRFTVNQDYMNNVKGLCGTNNGDNFDFITPQEYVLQNPEEFAATWALSSEGRTGEMKTRAQKHSMYKKSVSLTPVVSEQDVGRTTIHGTAGAEHESTYGSQEMHGDGSLHYQQLKKNSSPGCATRRIKVIEKGGKHCFSFYPEPTCTSQCRPETTQMKSGEFYCVEASSTSAHWQQMIARGANPDFRNKGVTEEIKFEYPTKCVQN